MPTPSGSWPRVKEARSRSVGPTWPDEERRLTEQARACRITWAMIVEDGYPVQLTVQAVDQVFPGHHDAVAKAAAGAATEVVT